MRYPCYSLYLVESPLPPQGIGKSTRYLRAANLLSGDAGFVAPELGNPSNGSPKCPGISGLAHKGVGPRIETIRRGSVVVGATEDDYRSQVHERVGANSQKEVQARHSRQIEVQEDKVKWWGSRALASVQAERFRGELARRATATSIGVGRRHSENAPQISLACPGSSSTSRTWNALLPEHRPSSRVSTSNPSGRWEAPRPPYRYGRRRSTPL